MRSLHNIRSDFPIYESHPDLVYLDSGATSLKPRSVIEKLSEYYSSYSANIHRGVYAIAEKASEEFEQARNDVARFIGSTDSSEVVFTKGATESLNLVASTWGEANVRADDEIVTSIMEHHANFVPWQQLALRKGAKFKVIGINDHFELEIVTKQDRRGELDSVKINFSDWITQKTKILAITYVSNVLGTINPIQEIIREAKRMNPHIIVVVDASQAVGHMKIDVKSLGCDFLVFSGHKMLGPTGVGVLWGKRELLEQMPPYQFGGDMIREVHVENSTWNDVPHKFEAGTPPIAEVIALKEAVRYIKSFDIEKVREREKELTMNALQLISNTFGTEVTFFTSRHIVSQSGIISFTLKGIHPHDVAQILDESHVCVRAGHHCAMPLHTKLGIPASVRATLHLYNDEKDVENLIFGLERCQKVLRRSKSEVR